MSEKLLEYQTTFPEIGEDEEKLIVGLAKAANVNVVTDEVTIISTDDAEFGSVLDMLRDRMDGVKNKPRVKKSTKPVGANWRTLPRSWTNEKTKEILSARELKRRTALGSVEN